MGVNCKLTTKGRVLYVGHSYYHTWYLSRELRKIGWRADVLNFDLNPGNDMYYHDEDFTFKNDTSEDRIFQLKFFLKSIVKYDIFHFSNAHGIVFGFYLHNLFAKHFGENSEIKLLKYLGKRIVYSNNGCLDGVSKTAFSQWGPINTCEICQWNSHPEVCSDERNLQWGKTRNELAVYQMTIGGNRVDYNDDPRVHEVPGFYCLDHHFWDPELRVPDKFRLDHSDKTIRIFHSIGNFQSRTNAEDKKNIKCSHIYFPLIDRLKAEGYPVELIFYTDIPNKEIRYYQQQADIVVDMLTFGWFGANIREAMMLGKPCVCFIRPEWLDSMRKEIPEYVNELPVISATPDTVYAVIKDLLDNPEKRRSVGRKSREFAVKWHSAEFGAKEIEKIYSGLLRQKKERDLRELRKIFTREKINRFIEDFQGENHMNLGMLNFIYSVLRSPEPDRT
jgi:glycosyltransferase involved in cell wall biosynthesis